MNPFESKPAQYGISLPDIGVNLKKGARKLIAS